MLQAPVLDKPPPPTKPPRTLKLGGDRYYIKATCHVRRSAGEGTVGDVWGFSKHIGITTRVESVAQREAHRRFEDGEFQVTPVECVFVPGEEPEKQSERIFWKFKGESVCIEE